MEQEQAYQFVVEVLTFGSNKKASDIFFAAGFPPCIKLDGKLTPVSKQALTPEQTEILVHSIMNQRQTEEFDGTNEANFAINPGGEAGRFRVNVYREQGHAGMVLRKINTHIPTIDELGLPSILKSIAMTKRGLVIFVGATGSGKSTSLAALVDWRNSNAADHIITVEDPIEYVHQHKKCIVTQREIGVDTADWDIALKNTLRQAPDVILMGEIRDRETMGYGLQFAETGHLCLATLHANSANSALERILNFFPEDRHPQVLMDMAMNVQALISQRLVPKVGGKGRVAAIEIMINSPLIKDLILKSDIGGIKDVMARSNEIGMKTFDQALFDLYEDRIISYEDALRNADSMNDIRLKIKLESKNRKGVARLEQNKQDLDLDLDH